MKILNNRRLIVIVLMMVIITTLSAIILNSCAVSSKIESKSGAQLWAENCQRCHNTPSPATFSPEQWETIGMHMQSRSLITDKERDKIVAFLKQ